MSATPKEHVGAAIELLKRARDHLTLAESFRAAEAARSALRSAEGARRNVDNKAKK